MINSYLKIVVRSLSKDLSYFLLNIFGLVLGMTCFVILAIFVKHEFSFDRSLPHFDNTYRITTYFLRGDQEVKWAITNGGLVEILKEKVSGIEEATKILQVQSNNTFELDSNKLFSIPKKSGFHVDANFFDVFQFEKLMGVDSLLLSKPGSIVLNEKFAKKLFDRIDIVGKTITVKDSEEDGEILTVTGVVKIPQNSHLQFDYVISGHTYEYWENYSDPQRGGFPVHVYFRTSNNVSSDDLQENIAITTKEVYSERMSFPIQKIADIHFNADNLFEHTNKGNINFVKILGIVSILIIIIAIINYVILANSKSMERAKEIGIRKTLGSNKWSLVSQFLLESVIICLIASFISLFVIEFSLLIWLPSWFDIYYSLSDQVEYIGYIIFLGALIGLMAGLFPAIRILRYNPVSILRGQKIIESSSRLNTRTILVTIQFIFTTIIISGTIIVLKQLEYLKNKDVGFQREQVINIGYSSDINWSSWQKFKTSIKQNSAVKEIGTSLYEFISDYNATQINVMNKELTDTTALRVQWNGIDYGLIPALDLEIIEGRNFSEDHASDSINVILNQAALRQLGIESIEHAQVSSYFTSGGLGKVIGVVSDFHFQSFDKEIIPIVFFLRKKYWESNLVVRLQTDDYAESLATLEKEWKKSGIEAPFVYHFMDDWFEKLIRKEEQLSNMVTFFSIVSIMISLLGLIGLISFTTEQKKKEIGIRKVFGASIKDILKMINSHFISFIVFAFVVAIPLTIWGINIWLQSFAYKVNPGWPEFLLTGIVVFLLSTIAISVQSWKAAKSNPVNVLKEE